MKVLLVKPYNLSDHIQPSLGLGWLATALRDRHKVTILDCIKEKVRPERFGDYLDKARPDIVGFQCYTFDLHNLKPMVKAAKEHGAVTVIGGPHPSTVPHETKAFFGYDLDYLFRGEAEIGFRKLVDKISGDNIEFFEIPGLLWQEGDVIRLNDRMNVSDLDSLGFPAWDLIKPQSYPEAQHGAFFRKFPIAPIMITRGCPHECTFCAGNLIAGRVLRKRSISHVLSEIQMLYREYGIREFHVVDDNFTMNRGYAKGLLRALKELKLDISWAVPNGVRMDTLDEELLELMKQTGLYLISLGIESGSDRVLKLMKKKMTVDAIHASIKKIHAHDIDIAGFFIIGFPGETEEDIRKTINFSLELGLVRANYFTYLPFPGTESYEELRESGELDAVDWENLYFMNAAYAPKGLDRRRLKGLQREAFLKFYLRPPIIIKNLAQIKSARHFGFLSRRFVNWLVK